MALDVKIRHVLHDIKELPASLPFSGKLRPPSPVWHAVKLDARLVSAREPYETRGAVLMWPLTPGFPLPHLSHFSGELSLDHMGIYFIKAQAYLEPIGLIPMIAAETPIRVVVGDSIVNISKEATYNKAKQAKVSPGGAIEVVFTVVHTGYEEELYAGFGIVQASVLRHTSPADIPLEGWFSVPLWFTESLAPVAIQVTVKGTLPTTLHYRQGRVFDVLRFIAPSSPPPYQALQRLDDDWDDNAILYREPLTERGRFVQGQAKYEFSQKQMTLKVQFPITYRGPGGSFSLGAVIVPSRLWGHGNPIDVPDRQWFFEDFTVPQSTTDTESQIDVVWSLPALAKGRYDVNWFIAEPRIAPDEENAEMFSRRYEDDWDEDSLGVSQKEVGA